MTSIWVLLTQLLYGYNSYVYFFAVLLSPELDGFVQLLSLLALSTYTKQS